MYTYIASFASSEYGRGYEALKLCILEEADVICCTLSSAGSTMLTEVALRSTQFYIDALIIDEATQVSIDSCYLSHQYHTNICKLLY
jgi:AAA domain